MSLLLSGYKRGLPQENWLRLTAAVIAVFIFAMNTATPMHDAFAALYVFVILLVATSCSLRVILATGAGCLLLSCISFLIKHAGEPFDGAYLRLLVSIIAICVATLLSARDRNTRDALSEQVRMLAFTHDTVIVRDVNDIILEWNEGATRLYGWQAEEAIGQKGSDLLHSKNVPSYALHELQKTGQWSGEIIRCRRDGQWITLDARWIIRFDNNGRPCGIIEFAADLTEQKLAAAEHKRSEQQYSAIFQSAGVAIYEVDCSVLNVLLQNTSNVSDDMISERLEQVADTPYIRDVNQAGALMVGCSEPRALAGTSLSVLFSDRKILLEALNALITGITDYTADTVFNGPNGKPVDVMLRITRPETDTEFRRVLVIAPDVTERNEAQTKLREAYSALAHAERITTLGQLTVSIAHEVNQPLSAITTFARSGQRWLKRPSPDLCEALECFDQIASNSTRAADIITRVHNMTRKKTIFYKNLNVKEILNEVILILKKEISKNNVTIKILEEKYISNISGDRIQIQQIFMNIIINAIDAMSEITERKRTITITIKPEYLQKSAISIEFSDTGPGFAAVNETDLFEPFVTTKQHGMGMGLSISREIAHAHGGSLIARNNTPYGAVVTLILPERKQERSVQ